MRINKYIAQATGLSRRAADEAISAGRVRINNQLATPGEIVRDQDRVTLDGAVLHISEQPVTIMLHKPTGYVCSRNGQGSPTIYELLPPEMHHLKPIGRLDKDSSGLLLLTNDGQLAHQLTHPSFTKNKRYRIALDQALQPLHHQLISDRGVLLDDGPSRLHLERMLDGDNTRWYVTMHEGRNRQIRRTFSALGYTVVKLQRLQFGPYDLGTVPVGKYQRLTPDA